MWEVLKALVTSKKFVASVGAVVAIVCTKVAGKFNIVIDPEISSELTKVICVMAAVFVGAQGVADHNKEAVKLAIDAGASVVIKDLAVTPPTSSDVKSTQ
jgi:hypothetical protein